MKHVDPNARVLRKIALNRKRNAAQDNTDTLFQLANQFRYHDHAHDYWNPEEFSLLWGTPLWRQASSAERVQLNHLYWVAYYSQIISAEIATILYNQTSAAALYGIREFAEVCLMLDLESMQERAHIHAFRTIATQTEQALYDDAIFLKPMKSPYSETMIYPDSSRIKQQVKKWVLRFFSVLSSSSAFIGCQYFTIRGMRTLNGKIVQHRLSQYYMQHPDQEHAPIPAKISYHHFLDESYHFNSSTIISQDLVRCLQQPTAFEKMVVNQGVFGCQRDHQHYTTAINGIFWFEPAMYQDIYHLLRSKLFGMDHGEALAMMAKCFTEETDGLHASAKTHLEAAESYENYIADLTFIAPKNKQMTLMKEMSVSRHLDHARKSFYRFANTPPREGYHRAAS